MPSPYDIAAMARIRNSKRGPYRDLARLRQQMREEVRGLREEILENRTTIAELKIKLEEQDDEA